MWTEGFLSRTAWVMAILGLVSAAAMVVDHRQITGVNAWLKPMKFFFSVAIYLGTVHVLLGYLDVGPARKAWIGGGIAVTMIVEMVCIVLQALRGVRSHYNFATPFDATVFAFMGTFIMANTVLLAWLGLEFVRHPSGLGSGMLWGVRFGVLSALLGSAFGFVMIRMAAHNVGVADGGPGLPLLNWSTMGGDLRIAHFWALHGLQLLPLLGWWLDRQAVPRAALLVTIAFVAIVGGSTLSLLQALSGKPLVAGAVNSPGAAKSKAPA